MKDKIKNLNSFLVKTKQSWQYAWELIEKLLLAKPDLSVSTKQYLFQCQVLLDSSKSLIEKYEKIVSESKEGNLTDEDYEYISQVLNNATADHQAKAISIENLLKLKD